MSNDNTVQTYDVKVIGISNDAGVCYDVVCPKCKDIIHLADHGWGDDMCSCGYSWSFAIVATGVLLR